LIEIGRKTKLSGHDVFTTTAQEADWMLTMKVLAHVGR
jgi:alkylation response protein AidB-like acyl-CoA dehydrogenase